LRSDRSLFALAHPFDDRLHVTAKKSQVVEAFREEHRAGDRPRMLRVVLVCGAESCEEELGGREVVRLAAATQL
jgi:hypothetical protein